MSDFASIVLDAKAERGEVCRVQGTSGRAVGSIESSDFEFESSCTQSVNELTPLRQAERMSSVSDADHGRALAYDA